MALWDLMALQTWEAAWAQICTVDLQYPQVVAQDPCMLVHQCLQVRQDPTAVVQCSDQMVLQVGLRQAMDKWWAAQAAT